MRLGKQQFSTIIYGPRRPTSYVALWQCAARSQVEAQSNALDAFKRHGISIAGMHVRTVRGRHESIEEFNL